MEWWQILWIVLGSIFVGILLAALISYLVKRVGAVSSYLVKPFVKKGETILPIEEQVKPAAPDLEYAAPDLVEEVENNLKIAAEPWTGKLLPFQIDVWHALQNEVDKLPENLRDDLVQVYIDIRLANSIVRLSTQFDHRSHDLNENYMKLRSSIAERLDRIKPLIEWPRE